eukprot:8292152-Pyramimonas_sp.AAC.1
MGIGQTIFIKGGKGAVVLTRLPFHWFRLLGASWEALVATIGLASQCWSDCTLGEVRRVVEQ